MFAVALPCLCKDLKNASAATQEWFAKDLLLTKTLLDCMTVVFEGGDTELASMKLTFTSASKGANSMSSGSHGAGKTQNALGSAPPTGTIQDLVTLKTLRAFHTRVNAEIKDKDDYKPLRGELVAQLGPLKDLISAQKKRVAAIDTRKQAWKNVKEQKFGDIASPTAAPISS